MTGFPTQLFIDGQLVRGASGKKLPQTNPATETVFAEVDAAALADLNRAVEGAHKCFQAS